MSKLEDNSSNEIESDETLKFVENGTDAIPSDGTVIQQEGSDLQNMPSALLQQHVSSIDDEQVMNPQDATLQNEPTSTTIDFPVTIHNDGPSMDDSSIVMDPSHAIGTSDQQQSVSHSEVMNEKANVMKVKRKVHKRSRFATINTDVDFKRTLPTPTNQYECWLIRRAILPVTPGTSALQEQIEDRDGYSVYGDIALGMKLSIADTGQVIVQKVTPLIDGRASPAQLTGRIQRGDILLSIDGISLADNNALAGLKPLQAPDDPKVECQRRYKLRLAAGAGLEILKSIEEHQSKVDADSPLKLPSDMLGLFPMVDQLSGIPLFDAQSGKENEISVPMKLMETLPNDNDVVTMEPPSSKLKNSLQLDKHISEQIASQRHVDKYRLLGSDDQTLIDQDLSVTSKQRKSTPLSLPERQNQGRQVIVTAMNLMKQVENIDAGKDVRSFQSWNTTLSLYSRASIRRRRVFDAASLPSKNFGRVVEHIEEKEEDDENNTSVESGNLSTDSNDVDGDELLLRLAAHDEIWRRQVIEFLENVALDLSTPQRTNEEKEKATPNDISAAMSKELGDFLFGENMAKILSTNRTPRALPSEEVTAVLFDLATKVSASVPDEIKAAGTIISSKSELTPFQEMKHCSSDNDISLASRFLLEYALPAWLKSFRPLAWEHRRILWPVNNVRLGGSTASTLSDDDGLTVDTTNVSLHSTITRQHRRKKSIQEIIEDQELDIETRGEACFLTTFYFIHALLPRLMALNKYDDSDNAEGEITTFLKDYGSYLRMDTCLAYASVLRATFVIDLLLSIAKHDPRHREAMKQMSKSTSMVFYESSMMSAILQLLQSILKEKLFDRKQAIIDLCAAAYPDIRPWQVESACGDGPSSGSDNLYYIYLSQLLHPIDGHDAARRDAVLVKEWCKRSIEEIRNAGSNEAKNQRENFLAVASRTSSHHLVYQRDLILLLNQSMSILEYGLALDLVSEILENPPLSSLHSTVDLMMTSLRTIAKSSLDSDDNEQNSIKLLHRIIHIFSKPSFRKLINVPMEILLLIRYKAGTATSSLIFDPKTLEFIQFLTEKVIPDDLLHALIVAESSPNFRPELLPILNRVLLRGSLMGSELSASLLRIKRARQLLEQASRNKDIPSRVDSESATVRGIWARMAEGAVTIEK